MKNKCILLFKSLAIIVLLLMINSCSRSDDGGSGTGNSQYYLKATAGNSEVNSTAVHSTYSDSGKLLVISGRWGENSKTGIDLRLHNYNKTTGTFNIDYPNNLDAIGVYIKDINSSDPNQQLYSETGTITIEEITTNRVKGKFEFKAVGISSGEVLMIKNGSFNSFLAQ